MVRAPAPPHQIIDLLPRRTLVRSQGPLYRQLADLLREMISSGVVPVNSDLPKEAELAERFGVSLITVRQALQNLEASGLIQKRSAKPAVVISNAPPISMGWTFKNFNDMAAFAKDAELRIKSYRLEKAAHAAHHFGLGADEKSYCLRSVLVAGKQHKAQITTYLPPDLGPNFQKQDFNDVLIFRAVQRRLNIRMSVAQCTVRAEVADESVVADLRVTKGSPLLVVEMLYKDANQRPVEYSIARHPADIFSIRYDAPNDLI